MKIINKRDNTEFMHIKDGKPYFTNQYVGMAFAQQGIFIPSGMRDEYGGKDMVRLNDVEFEKAFRELYYGVEMEHDVFVLIED